MPRVESVGVEGTLCRDAELIAGMTHGATLRLPCNRGSCHTLPRLPKTRNRGVSHRCPTPLPSPTVRNPIHVIHHILRHLFRLFLVSNGNALHYPELATAMQDFRFLVCFIRRLFTTGFAALEAKLESIHPRQPNSHSFRSGRRKAPPPSWAGRLAITLLLTVSTVLPSVHVP